MEFGSVGGRDDVDHTSGPLVPPEIFFYFRFAEILTRYNEMVSHYNEIVSCYNEILTCYNELLSRYNEKLCH